MDESTSELEVVGEPSGKQRGTIVKTDRSWAASPLAALSDADFAYRLKQAGTEMRRLALIQKEIMVADVDYGTVPGIKKPMLFQSGCQKLNRFAALVPEYENERTDGDGDTSPTISYVSRCRLLDHDGRIVGEGYGTANTWEVKYRYRFAERTCPKCGVSAVLPSQYDEKYYCSKKKDGCGAKFKDGAESERIDNQPSMGENEDPHDLDNTILKMSCKRSYVAATVVAHAVSGQFSQEFTDEGDAGNKDTQPTARQRSQARKGAPRKQAGTKTQTNGNGNTKEDEVITPGKASFIEGKLRERIKEVGFEPTDEAVLSGMEILLGKLPFDAFTDVTESAVQPLLMAIAEFEPPVSK